ncbi:MAG: DMT family transporter [Desulfovibrio sp.]|nr:DMT family transporter [Desulfovibrio sp.]
MNGKIAGALAGLGATAIWAGNFIAARALADQIPPIQFNFWRWAIALLAILPFGLKGLRNDWQYAKKNFGYVSLMAIIGVTFMNSFIYKAGQTTGSVNMAFIMPFTPAAILILSRLIYGEKISWQKWLGVVIATSGIFTLISGGSWDRIAELSFKSGDIWTLGCMLCFALYSVFMRERSRTVSSVGFNIIVFALGLCYTAPLVVGEMIALRMPALTTGVIAGVLYSGIGCSALAFWLWTVAIDKLGPSTSGILYYTLPVFAAIMAKVVLDETAGAAQILGGALIICGALAATVNIRFLDRGKDPTQK